MSCTMKTSGDSTLNDGVDNSFCRNVSEDFQSKVLRASMGESRTDIAALKNDPAPENERVLVGLGAT